ncbi:MAG: hypothetical protein RLZZ347_535 [Candidatus Parcubacteria bacterium]|jgi:hypothetical protein
MSKPKSTRPIPNVIPPIEPKVWQEMLECRELAGQMADLEAEVKKHVPVAASRAMTGLVATHGVKGLEINAEQTKLVIILGNDRKLVFKVSDVNDAWIEYPDKVYDSASDPDLAENRKKLKALSAEHTRRWGSISESDRHAFLFGKRC